MKLEFLTVAGGPAPAAVACRVTGETQPLRDVLVVAPDFLEPVPCCSATRSSLRDGFRTCRDAALAQHRTLRDTLAEAGVTVHVLPAVPHMPDLCFARDSLAVTPWGLVVLNPALPHRRAEIEPLVAGLERLGLRPVDRIADGRIEGGDVCIAAPGRLIIGQSDERTDAAGLAAFSARFRDAGWSVLVCPLDPHFLHLDTVFCMVDAQTALACVDVLDDGFLAAVAAWGIRLIPVSYKESRALGCNILSLGGGRIVLAAGVARVEQQLRRHGFTPLPVDVSQFTACGGGVHCLTMPLVRD